MINQQPWQTIVNKSFLTEMPNKETSLTIVNKAFTSEIKKHKVPVINLASAKRYSFDDNGGGYLGL